MRCTAVFISRFPVFEYSFVCIYFLLLLLLLFLCLLLVAAAAVVVSGGGGGGFSLVVSLGSNAS